MKLELDNLLENDIIEPGRVTELFCNGKSIAKCMSEDVYKFSDEYSFVNFNREKSTEFNEAFYKINVEDKNKYKKILKEYHDENIIRTCNINGREYKINSISDVETILEYFEYIREDDKEKLLDEMYNFVLDENTKFEKKLYSLHKKQMESNDPDERQKLLKKINLYKMGKAVSRNVHYGNMTTDKKLESDAYDEADRLMKVAKDYKKSGVLPDSEKYINRVKSNEIEIRKANNVELKNEQNNTN